MKTLYLIIAISPVVFSASLAYAEQPLLDFYNNSHLVLVGKVISLYQVATTTNNPTQSPNQTRYDIQVEQYYKNPQSAKIITVYGYAKGIYYGQDPTYDVGDRVFLYLNQENGYYQIQPHSFALNNNCDARPMIPMPTLPFEPPPISTPAARGDIFSFETDTGSTGYFFRIGDKIHVNFVAENYMPVMKDATLNFTIKTENDTKIVHNDTKHVTIPPCNGRVPISWDFTPNYTGTYFVHENTYGSVSLGNQVILFNDPSLGSSFTVRENMAGGTIDKSLYPPLPLTQFRSGIKAEDVKCKDGFMLVTKTTDSSPACVKPLTYNKLALQGWAKLLGSTTTTYVTVNGTTYDIPYTIRGYGNKMLYIESDSPMKYLVTHVESTAEKGELTMTIPKTLLDPKMYGQSEFTVLVDGIETKYTEISTGDTNTLTIPFGFGAKEIEVLAIGVGMQTSSEKYGTLSGTVSAFVYGGPLGSSQNQSAHYEVDVYATDGITIVGKTFSDSNAKYSLQLPAGNYIIYTYNDTKQIHLVSVYSEKNTVFDISSSLVVP